ncbi:hypothetical protein CQ020_22455 [Arthrobacter sp. MYb23]|uniref:hypothetical protein n=1 Tax=unclassified Arthrobacter TaxID=235627 RepID=UPI000CFDD9F1|nr:MULTISPECIES: hypothetical protein [unclassified Arthrobacter]PRB35905.1 hypothetical protein CQ038_22000 [Arthrobacter sp. MYb51]PRB89280.1 hypothetical protein CQ020_22455 [Arthrobacter sp. MYb23]
MPNSSAQGTLRLNTQSSRNTQASEDVTFTLDSSKPMTVRIEVDHCPCGSEHNRAGSYVDSDFGR